MTIDVGSTVRYAGKLCVVREVRDEPEWRLAWLEGSSCPVSLDELVRVRPCICARPDLCTEALPTMACRAGHIYSPRQGA